MKNRNIMGHLLAIFTIFIWGITFISTKILLTKFSPEEILFYRFLIAFLVLIIIYPKKNRLLSIKEEILFCILGITGISLYYWTENLALKYTYASNVSLILSAIPIFTALILHFIAKDEKFTINLFLGFITAIMGICIVIYNGKILKLNPRGDLMAVLSAFLFSIYSILIKRVNRKYNQIFIVKKIFFYGILTMVPILFISKVTFFKMPNLTVNIVLNFFFLSIFASVLCFLMWNKAINVIGSIKTANYIYLVPLITIISSSIILNEKVNRLMLIGGGLIFAGVYINESKWINKIFNYLMNWRQVVNNRKDSF